MIIYTGITEIGSVRQINQDNIALLSKGDVGLFVVADGMGGHQNGEIASKQIIDELTIWWNEFSDDAYDKDFTKMTLSICTAIERANKVLNDTYGDEKVVGSTVVLLFVYKNAYAVINVGDSRCYQFHKLKWRQLSFDDVWENQPGLSISEKSAKDDPRRGKLVSAVGPQDEVKCHIITDSVEPGMKFILCSDGLYRFCSEKIMRRVLFGMKKENIENACNKLKAEVYKNGARDNVSILLVGITK